MDRLSYIIKVIRYARACPSWNFSSFIYLGVVFRMTIIYGSADIFMLFLLSYCAIQSVRRT